MPSMVNFNPATAPVRSLMTVSDLADYLGVSRWTVTDWSKRPDFPQPILLSPGGRRRRWRRQDVDAWLDARRQRRADGDVLRGVSV